MNDTKNRSNFLCRPSYATDTKNEYFLYRLFKTTGTENQSLFLVLAEIIDRHHRKNLGVTLNRFSSSVYS
jgi:hypothetical protein